MSTTLIRIALEKRLDTMSPALSTAWENANFAPVSGIPYQQVHLMRGKPQNPTFDTFRREVGFMQVSLYYPRDAGPAAAEARAELIVATFPRKLVLVEQGVRVTIDATPYVMAGFVDEDRWCVPVRIQFYSNIS